MTSKLLKGYQWVGHWKFNMVQLRHKYKDQDRLDIRWLFFIATVGSCLAKSCMHSSFSDGGE